MSNMTLLTKRFDFQHELKETGHTPELITEKDREEAPAANRKPPLEKSQSQGVNGKTTEGLVGTLNIVNCIFTILFL